MSSGSYLLRQQASQRPSGWPGAILCRHQPGHRGRTGRAPRLGGTDPGGHRAADAAWPAWRGRTAKERESSCGAGSNSSTSMPIDLALLMTSEQGKPLARPGGGELRRFLRRMVCRGGQAGLRRDHRRGGYKRMLVIKQPIGVCAAITPGISPRP